MKLLAKLGCKETGGLGIKQLRSIKNKSEKENHDTLSFTMDASKSNEGGGKVGEKRKGISRPAEVVVRLDKLGLGFGSFKETTKLKTNIRIEAGVKGVDWKKRSKKNERKKKKNNIKSRKS